uniref:Uncharacterized protein n=1 Tax=Hyaloperonospora arabidopsidis (strain Emoy2) TaxID=559515 RepID=M4BQY5_HYAAE
MGLFIFPICSGLRANNRRTTKKSATIPDASADLRTCITTHAHRLRKSARLLSLQFGVEAKSKDAKGSATCWCLFCLQEGRDEVEVGQNGRKRKETGNIKDVHRAFLPAQVPQSFTVSHTYSWALYTEMSNADKALYFASKIKPTNTLHRHMELKDEPLTYDISARIVETIIGDLFFRDDEVLADSNVDEDSEDDVPTLLLQSLSHEISFIVGCTSHLGSNRPNNETSFSSQYA